MLKYVIIGFLKYPKLTALLGTFAAAYLLYTGGALDRFLPFLNGHGYWTMLFAGLAYSFGFTAAFGTALIVELSPSIDPALGAIIGGLGAALTDIGLFSLIRSSMFSDEIRHLKDVPIVRRMRGALRNAMPSKRGRRILLWIFAGIIIASPLPDEFGVTLVGAMGTLRPRTFCLLCLLLNTLGIFAILSGAKMVMG